MNTQRDNDRAADRHRHIPEPEVVVANTLRDTSLARRGGNTLRALRVESAAIKVVRDLRAAGFTFMVPVCEACDDESGWYDEPTI